MSKPKTSKPLPEQKLSVAQLDTNLFELRLVCTAGKLYCLLESLNANGANGSVLAQELLTQLRRECEQHQIRG